MSSLPVRTNKVLLSPEPKRLYTSFTFVDSPEPSRSRSFDLSDENYLSELGSILSQNNFPIRNQQSLLTPSYSSNKREIKNPMISDSEFLMLESTLSTSEDSDSEADRNLQSF